MSQTCKIYWSYIPPNEIRERTVYCCKELRDVVEKGETKGGALHYRIVHNPHHNLALTWTGLKVTECPFCGAPIEEIEEAV